MPSSLVHLTDAEGGSDIVIAAEQLRAGDIVEYGGARHLVAEIRRPCGAAWPMAVDRDGWAIALGSLLLRVERHSVPVLLAA